VATRTITIIVHDAGGGGYDVFEGERYQNGLCWDEMLGQIAAMTIPVSRARPDGLYGMETPEERERFRSRWFPPTVQQPNPPLLLPAPERADA